MFTMGRVWPGQRPELPGEVSSKSLVNRRRPPRSIVDLDLDVGDRGAPGGPHDPISAVLACHPGGRRLEPRLAYRSLGPDRLPVALLLADGHIIARHELAHEPRVDHLDAVQPLH